MGNHPRGLMLGFLNDNAGALQALFAGIVTLATVAYVLLTRELALETRAMRRAGSEPRIAIYPEPSPRAGTVLDLVIENIGAGSAYDVRFELPETWVINPQSGRTLNDYHLMRRGIGYLAPRQRITFMVAIGPELAKQVARSFPVVTRYRSLAGEATEERFVVEFDPLLDLARVSGNDGQKAAAALEKIATTLDRGSQSGRLRVELWTQADIAERDRQFREWAAEEHRKAADAAGQDTNGPPTDSREDKDTRPT